MSTAVQQCPTYTLHAGEAVTHTCMHMKPFYKQETLLSLIATMCKKKKKKKKIVK